MGLDTIFLQNQLDFYLREIDQPQLAQAFLFTLKPPTF